MEKLRILVVEDGEDNAKAAKAMLSEHDVTVVAGFDSAKRLIRGVYNNDDVEEELQKLGLPEHIRAYSEKYNVDYWEEESERKNQWDKTVKEIQKSLTPLPFDVLLTDVNVPKDGYDMMSEDGIKIVDKQGSMPYGAYIALHAIAKGIMSIGIITSGDHHTDPFVYALDNLKGFTIGELKVVITNYLECYVSVDDYGVIIPSSEMKDYRKAINMEQEGKAVQVKNWLALLDSLQENN